MKKFLVILAFVLSISQVYAVDYRYNSDGSVSLTWVMRDMAGLYTQMGSVAKLICRGPESDSHYAKFTAAGVSFYTERQYYWYYPYSPDYVNGLTELPISYLNQTQNGNGNMSHLGAYDFMSSQSVLESATDAFKLRHLGSMIRIKAEVNTSVSIKSVSIESSGTKFITNALMNYKDGSITVTSSSEVITLDFAETIATESKPLEAYIMVAPGDYRDSQFTLTITTTDGQTISGIYSGVCLDSGMVYPLEMRVTSFAKTSAVVNNSSVGNGDDEPLGAKGTFATAEEKVTYPMGYAPDFMPAGLIPTRIDCTNIESIAEAIYTVSGMKIGNTRNTNHTLVIKGGKTMTR